MLLLKVIGSILGLLIVLAVLFFTALVIVNLPRKDKPIAGKRIIACIGDSITFGTGVAWHRHRDAWPYLLAKQLGNGYQVLNYGISGATLQNTGNFPYRKHDFLQAAKDSNPETVILMLGTNDSKPYNWNAKQYEKELAELLEELKATPSRPQIYVMTPPFAVPAKGKETVAFDIRNEVIRNEIRPTIQYQAQKHQVSLIDLYGITAEHPEYYSDGVHPNQLGNQVIANCIYENLKRDAD